MTPYQQIKDVLIWQPMLAGLEVHEPQTVLEVNLAWGEWERAKQSMDDMAAFAVANPEVVR